MSPARIFNRVPLLFIIVSIAPAIALAAAARPAPAAPIRALTASPVRPARMPIPARPAQLPVPARLSIATGLAASVMPARVAGPASAHSPRYILTAYPRQSAHQAPRRIASAMMAGFGWPRREFRYLNRLWQCESGWNPHAANPYSGAYGIPQAYPASKLGTAGPDWRWSARTQIRWGLRYIAGRYGRPSGAWSHEAGYGWY